MDSLGNRDQIRIVTAPVKKNVLILAGPGSGKTRTVVHRCAFLLRVKRVRPRAILVCCFNHKAALELRQRLAALVGKDARGVTIQTYHGLALRILGRSVSGISEKDGADIDFDKLIADAVAVLRAEKLQPGVEPDDVRDRLLAGFEHILVDEYQDIDEPQYEMISAIAGRTLQDVDRKLTILAVGDDDQSIYGFRGANVEFIRRFRQDYEAEVAYLVENYRSTRHIIEASNRVIALNRDRMKTDKPIRIDQGRGLVPPGGFFGQGDPLTRGRVAVVEVRDAGAQAGAVVKEIQRLRGLGVTDWIRIAVLSRTKRDLARIRAEAERADIPVSWPLDRTKVPPLHRMREVARALEALARDRAGTAAASELAARVGVVPAAAAGNQWLHILSEVLADWSVETGDEPAPVGDCIEYIYEALAQRRRDEQIGHGVILNTVHSAKGTEHDHVLLCGDWSGVHGRSKEEERRTFYVGMTRARQTLSIFIRADRRNPFADELVAPCFASREEREPVSPAIGGERDYTMLGLEDMFLDFAGRRAPDNRIHGALSALNPGDKLSPTGGRGSHVWLADSAGVVVAQMSARSAGFWGPRLDSIGEIRVLGLVVRKRTDNVDPEYQPLLRTDAWEVPICEIVGRADLSLSDSG